MEERRENLQREILVRAGSVDVSSGVSDPDYAAGMRNAVIAALDFAIEVLERGDGPPPPVPEAVLAQARLAARKRTGLGTVLRRYVAGFSLLSEAALRVAARQGGSHADRLIPLLSARLDFLLARVGEDYMLEQEHLRRTTRTRRAEAIKFLLAGMPVLSEEIVPAWGSWHVGFVGVGPGALEVLAALRPDGASPRVLVERFGDEIWGWVNSAEPLSEKALVASLPEGSEQIVLGIGEPGRGLEGWRRSHRQALAVLPVARERRPPVALYGEAGLLATAVREDLLETSLRDRYLAPLSDDRGGSEGLTQTLRAYLATECNVSSTAALLGVSRRTVRNRLRRVEERTQVRIGDHLGELDLALRIAALRSSASGRD